MDHPEPADNYTSAPYSKALAEFQPQLTYSYSVAIEAATRSLTDGNASRVARECGLPIRTLWDWTNAPWWQPLLTELRQRVGPQLDAALSGLVERALESVRERLETGDEAITKDGDVVRLKVKALDAMKIGSIAFDKRQLLRRQPTSIRESSGQLSSLAGALDEYLRRENGRTLDAVQSPVDKYVSDAEDA